MGRKPWRANAGLAGRFSISVNNDHKKKMATTYGIKKLAFGSTELKPLKGFPDGRIRIRVRNNEFVRVFVKSTNGIREFFAEDQGDCWTPAYEQGGNYAREVTAESIAELEEARNEAKRWRDIANDCKWPKPKLPWE